MNAPRMVSSEELDELARQAGNSTRGRSHLILHASHADPIQRYFVCVDRRSYVRPHRHARDGELAVVVRGKFDLLVFDDHGTVASRHTIGGGPLLTYELPAATWHSLVAGVDGSVLLEVKPGPYDPQGAASFAPWAPPEGDPAAAEYAKWLARAVPGDSHLR